MKSQFLFFLLACTIVTIGGKQLANASEDVNEYRKGSLTVNDDPVIELNETQVTEIRKLLAASEKNEIPGPILGIPWAYLTLGSDKYFFPADKSPVYATVVKGKKYISYGDVTLEVVRRILESPR